MLYLLEAHRMSLQHGVQLVSQVVEHVADVIQNVSGCLHCAAAAETHRTVL